MNRLVKWDTRSGDIVQEYDCHLGLVNFVNGNRRFVTTSNDKSLCCECSHSCPAMAPSGFTSILGPVRAAKCKH
ncbi:hypothetical protein pipiens_015897 [Culex pipiens pipiens]|uniref:Uncharacterized protein n=1 Tax=Culex pipiens pipiens TaxID=38569 RepID=A0ABD1CQ44_CULPP